MEKEQTSLQLTISHTTSVHLENMRRSHTFIDDNQVQSHFYQAHSAEGGRESVRSGGTRFFC